MPKKTDLSDFKQISTQGKVAAIYVRVSQNEFQMGADGEKEYRQSVKTQREDGKLECKKSNRNWKWKVYDKDCELSGSLPPEQRPSLQQLLADMEDGKVHTVIIRDVKRLARNAKVLKDMLHDYFLPHGVNLIGTNTPIDIKTPTGRMVIGILAEVAEADLHYIRMSSMRGREGKAKEGTLALNPYTYGYTKAKNGSVVIVDAEALVVKDIFKKCARSRLSCQRIADHLNAKNVPTKWHKKKDHKKAKNRKYEKAIWSGAQIYRTLKNVRYISKISYNGEVYDSPFPRIITDKLWYEVKDEMKTRANTGRRTHNSKYLMTGILKCGYCLDKKIKKGERTYPNMVSMMSTKHRYYVCQAKRCQNLKCTGVSVPQEKIEKFIENFIGAFTADQFSATTTIEPDVLARLISQRTLIRAEMAESLDKIKKAPNELPKLGMTIKFVANSVKALEKSVTKLQEQLRLIEKEIDAVSNKSGEDSFGLLKEWKSLDMSAKRRALMKVLPKAVMYEDHLDMYFGNENSTKYRVDYLRMDKRRKARDFPAFEDDSVFFDDEGNFRYGGDIGAGMKAFPLDNGGIIVRREEIQDDRSEGDSDSIREVPPI